MKAILTLILTLTFGALALAQNNATYAQVESNKVDVVLDNSTERVERPEQIQTAKENDLARVYKFKNARIKKALAFSTKNNRPKLA